MEYHPKDIQLVLMVLCNFSWCGNLFYLTGSVVLILHLKLKSTMYLSMNLFNFCLKIFKNELLA